MVSVAVLSCFRAASAPVDLAVTLQPLVQQYQLPGAVGAIIHGSQVVALGSTGVRKIGEPIPFLSGDIIHLGSDTKAMTALLIGKLIDKRRLTFNSTMSEIFPDLAAEMDPQMAKVTVRNLLDHNAGFAHDLDWWELNATRSSLPAQRRLAVKKALSAPPSHPIGTFFYSNVSFVLLGAIIEAKTGISWEQEIQEELFKPLHMTTAGFGPPGTQGMVDQPWGHVLDADKLKPVHNDNARVMAPAGTVHCSIVDWSHFVAEILRGEQGHPTLVSPATFKALITPVSGQDYAGGWIVTERPWAGGRTLTHSGSNTTWFCTVWIAPNKDFAVLIAINSGANPVGKAADDGIGRLIKLNSTLATNP